MTKEITRTLVYLGVCAASLLAGYFTWSSNRPREINDYALVGEEFYPEFNDPNEATSLEVTVFDEDKATISTFEVEYKDGLWRIPSHHDYPADAKEQLAKTAASIIGIKREALASRLETDQAQYGVIDPRLEDSSKLQGRGSRITLKKGDEILADYILGNEHKDGGGRYYVRAPEEKVTYLAHFDVDLSTKFSDWIDTDLLKIDRNKLNDIEVRKYSIDEEAGQFKNRETNELTREKFGSPWELVGLDEATEEVNSDAVKDLASALVDLKIVGVRPKPQGLSADLEWDPRFSQVDKQLISAELAQKGFLLARYQDGGLVLLAQEGSFLAKTDEGINYELLFGNVFTGDLNEIEIGNTDQDQDGSEAESSEAETEQDSDGQPSDSAGNQSDEEQTGDQKKESQQSRYVFVKVNFAPEALGPEPAPPTPPQDPGPFDPNAPLTAPGPGEPSLSPQEEFQQAQQKHAADLEQYEQDLKAYQEKLDAGQKKAKELSERLGAWYYVVPAKDVEALRVSRANLVQPKGTDAAKEQSNQQPGAGSPNLPFTPPQLQLPGQN